MGTLFILTALFTACVVLFTYFKYIRSYWKRRGVPYIEPDFLRSKKGLPITTRQNIAVVMEGIYKEARERNLKGVGFYAIASPFYVAVDPQVIRSILSVNFHNFPDRGIYHNEKAEPLMGHLFFLEGKQWKDLRTKLTPTFTSGKMKSMFNVVVECTIPLLKAVDSGATLKKPVDIKEACSRFTLDVIGSCAFGLDCKSFESEEAEFRKYTKKIGNPDFMLKMKTFIVTAFPDLAHKLNIGLIDKEVSNFFRRVINEMVEHRKLRQNKRGDFLELIIDLMHENEEFTTDILAAQAYMFFVAGFGTSSSAMTFCLYELALNQELQHRLRREINDTLSKYDNKLTYEAVQDMTYLGQVLDETLRLHPPAAVHLRKCSSDCFVKEAGVVIEKGIKVIIPAKCLHYDPEYFLNPYRFDPERFSPENKGNIVPYSYTPFGEGPRNCIGSRFGLMQSKVGLVSLIKNFEFTVNDGTPTSLHVSSTALNLNTNGKILLDVKRIE